MNEKYWNNCINDVYLHPFMAVQKIGHSTLDTTQDKF